MWVGERHAQAALTPGKKTWYPLYMRLGGSQDRSGRVRKISLPTGIRSSDQEEHKFPIDVCSASW